MHRATVAALALALGCGPVRLLGTDGDGGGDDDGSSESGDASSDAQSGDGGDPSAPSGGDGGPGDGNPSGGGPGGDDGMGDDGSTGDTPQCGDGFLDPGEACDDGNQRPGDGCEADCTVSAGVLLWSETIDAAAEEDSARAVAVSGSEILVAGSMEVDHNDDAWLRVVSTDGVMIENQTIDYGEDEMATAIAITPDGTAYIAGVRPDSDGALLLRREATGIVSLDTAPTEISAFNALASPTSEGFVLVSHSGDFGSFAATVRRYDSAATVLGDLAQPEGTFVGAAIPSPSGGTILGGGSFGGMGNSGTVWLAALEADGAASWSSSMEADPGTSMRIRGLAIAGDGSIVGVGTSGSGNPMNDDDTGWIWWWSADGMPQRNGPLDVGGATTRPSSVVVGAHGLVVGGISVALEDGFVAGLSLDSELQWGYPLAGDAGLEDRVNALALVPGVGVVAVGQITQLGTGPDAWIGVFTD